MLLSLCCTTFCKFEPITSRWLVSNWCPICRVVIVSYISQICLQNHEFAKLRALRAFALSRLRALAPYAPSCLTCLHALRVLIFTRLNQASSAPYLLFARLTHSRYIFISSSFSFFRIDYFNGYVSIIVVFIIIIIIINSFQLGLKNSAK